jgi:hypothetical protein
VLANNQKTWEVCDDPACQLCISIEEEQLLHENTTHLEEEYEFCELGGEG